MIPVTRDVVIGAVDGYDWPKISPWVNSLEACGFTGSKVVLAYNITQELISKLKMKGFRVIEAKILEGIAVHSMRFWHIGNFMYNEKWAYRYAICTDTRDVVFQSNPSDWLEKNLEGTIHSINLSTEGLKLKDEEWGRGNVIEAFGKDRYEQIKDNVILNSGVISGNLHHMSYLFQEIFIYSTFGKARLCDQAALNLIMNHSIYKEIANISTASDGYCAQLGTMANSLLYPVLVEPTPVFNEGEVYTSDGKKYPIIHQYDRVEGLRDRVWGRYWSEN